MYVPRPGHTFVLWDWDALEMRLGAFLSGDETFLKDLAAWDARTGPKVHIINMCNIFGLKMEPGVETRYPAMYVAAKTFAYACLEKSTQVALLNGSKPISEVQAGDWTWCWADGQYTPTKIRNVWKVGERSCVKVTVFDGRNQRKSVTVTPEHRMMLRDGSYREAGELKPNDRLMPFRRYTMKNGYNEIDPLNDGGRAVVVEVGMREVWDLEVDNPAHNFALDKSVFVSNCAYGAGPTTAFAQVRAELPDMEWATFLVCYENYKKLRRGLFQFQCQVVLLATQHQYWDSAILKRRMWFWEKGFGEDSPEASRMANAPYQSTSADVVSLANRRVVEQLVIPMRAHLKKKGDRVKVGGKIITIKHDEVLEQLAQVHDELLFEVPERLASEFAAEGKSLSELPASQAQKSWNLPVDVKITNRWKKIERRCGGENGKCKEMVTIEPNARTPGNVTWGGECKKCKNKVIVSIPRSSHVTP